VYVVGHQPLATKNGKDEMDVGAYHFQEVKRLLEEYKDIIKVGLFGHRNLAGVGESSFLMTARTMLYHTSFVCLSSNCIFSALPTN
jgi:hypothetical protein